MHLLSKSDQDKIIKILVNLYRKADNDAAARNKFRSTVDSLLEKISLGEVEHLVASAVNAA